ncbi:MAG: hypothetical protein RIM99_11660 [Cyclobacteriaceae bacterium]
MKLNKVNLIASIILILTGCSSSKKERGNSTSNQKDSFYESVQLGDYGIGFCDTIIYNNDLRFEFLPDDGTSYSQYDYKGPTPLFLQIWYPIEQSGNQPLMFKDFRSRNLSSELRSVYDPLVTKMDSFFVQYNIIEDFINYDSIDYNGISYFEVLDTLMTFQTKSRYKKVSEKLDFPVVVYHHGGQGLSDENFVLAEYFASLGYIVVTSNFHLPFEDKIYGYEGIEFDDTALPKSVIRYAQTLTTSDRLYYIGHSAGAQVGFKFLYERGWADAFVSLETTLEGRPVDYLKSEDGWPKLSNIIDEHKLDYTIPILMIANTQEEKAFPLFDELTNSSMIQVSQKEAFGHESYTAGYLMRYLYRDVFEQPDTTILKSQLNLYSEQLKLIHAFFVSMENGEKLNVDEYKKDFYFSMGK